MERRAFIQAMGTALVASRLPLKAEGAPGRITLLHTNDTHSRIEPFGPGSGRLTGMGGIARRATLIRQIRAETPNVLLLDAGDVFQGTPYFNQYKGLVEFKLMSMCGYDAGTLGNHDFDLGVEGLLAALAEARFPILNCNFDAAGAPALAARLRPWTILERSGIKVGLTGVGVEFAGLVTAEDHRGVQWRDPVAALRPVVRHLRDQGADLVVLLSHLGYDRQGDAIDDLNLARLVPGVDVIIGGHTHTFLDAPVRVANAAGETEIFQVGFAGVNLGRMDLRVRDGVKLAASGMAMPVLA
jgi:5'-nucleotidase